MARFQCNVISYVLQRTVDITVIVPTVSVQESFGLKDTIPSHVIKDKYPILYLLHGIGNNHASWCGYTNIELYAEERNIAVAMISAENKHYRMSPNGDDYFRFLSVELPEFITNMFPVSSRAEDTYIAGLSMGGYGALLHGLTNPEKYAAIGSFSGVVQGIGTPEELADSKNQHLIPAYLVEKDCEEHKTLPPIYLVCGEQDFLIEENVRFKDLLIKKEIDHTWVSLSEYGHEWRFWDIQIEEFLKWIPRTDAYSKQQIRSI